MEEQITITNDTTETVSSSSVQQTTTTNSVVGGVGGDSNAAVALVSKTVRSIGGATFVFKIKQGDCELLIACDPVLCPKNHVQNYGLFNSTRLQEPALEGGDADLLDVDLWLLTHGHEDHLDSFGLDRILKGKKSSIIIAHPSVESLMKKTLKQKDVTFGNRTLHWMSPRQDIQLSVNGFDISLRSVNAFHGSCRKIGALVGNGNGYLLSISTTNSNSSDNNNGTTSSRETPHSRFYITGDSIYNEDNISDDFKELNESHLDFIITNGGEASADKKSIIGSIATKVMGAITNNSKNIIELHKKFKPTKTLVVHHGTFSHYSELISDKTGSFEGNEGIEAIFPGETVNV